MVGRLLRGWARRRPWRQCDEMVAKSGGQRLAGDSKPRKKQMDGKELQEVDETSWVYRE